MRILFLALLVTQICFGCKSPAPQSQLRSIVEADPVDPSKFTVYYMDSGKVVYRKVCSKAQIASPENCPTTPAKAEMDWKDYRTALVSQGITITTANGIGESLASNTAWDSTGNPSLVQQMEAAFNIDVTQSSNPFPQTFIGTPQNGSVQIPDPSTTTMGLAIDLVKEEMDDAFDYFDATDTNYKGGTHPFPSDAIVTSSVRTGCFGNAVSVSHWSDIVFHYYCQFGALRGCFTGQVSGGPKTYDHYKKGYDACIASDANFRRYFDGTEPNIDYDQRRAVFQHIMFSVYAAGGTGVFNRDEQDKAINAHYKESAGSCNTRPWLPRPSSDPLFRPQGQHCSDSQSPTTPVVVNLSKDVCATVANGMVSFQIKGGPNAQVDCRLRTKGSTQYSGFGTSPTFDSNSGRWVCAPWTQGNPGWDVQITVDGTTFDTDEPTAVANVCP